MLIKATELVAWQIQQLNGKPIAKVADVVFANHQGELKGIITEDQFFIDKKYIQQFGDGYLVIEQPLEKIKQSLKESGIEKYRPVKEILGMTFISENGNEIGKVGDVIVNTEQLQITKYEISDGLLKDMVRGRRVINCDQVVQEKKGNRLIVNIDKESG